MKKIFYCLAILLTSISYSFASDSLTIDIDGKEVKKISIVFEKINYVNSVNNRSELTEKIMNAVNENLKTTNLFSMQSSDTSVFDNYNSVKNLSSVELTNLVVAKYNKQNVDAVLSGFLQVDKDNNIELKIRLWDVLDQRELFSKFYIINDGNWKRISDVVSDVIFEFLTGEISGHFDTKIIYVAESGKVTDRKKQIAMVDFDGGNLNYLTNGQNLVLTPIFSKYNKNEIIYLEYKDKKPHLFKLDLSANELKMIGNLTEMTFAPSFNPSGLNEIVFSGTNNGVSNIYKLNFDEKKIKQLTFDDAISTSPSWSPDGEKIVFVSDKTGIRKLYIMNSDGSNIEMISGGRGVYDKPSWSPDGKLISFVKLEGKSFSIGLMTPKGESERTIMSAYLVEGIKWSPNGRYLIYSKQKGPFGKASIPGIYIIDILTGTEHQIPTPENQGATDPDWIKK